MRVVTTEPSSLTSALQSRIAKEIAAVGGWLPFDRFMELALYAPGLGYYANETAKFGTMPESGSDFVTAPEISPIFGQLVASQLREALQKTNTREIWEFGAGTGALALQILDELAAQGALPERYTIVDLSGTLRARQKLALAKYEHLVRWVDALPDAMEGVIIGNEVLDAMPVQLLQRTQGQWHERGVVLAGDGDEAAFAWEDRATELRPPVDIGGPHDFLTEIHRQGEAFIHTLGERLTRGAAFFIDYGFGESEYYHEQRHMGTLVCHYQHQVDNDPLVLVGLKDITAHVNFTGTAVAAQDAGFDVLGYTNQAHFLINCGLAPKLDAVGIKARSMASKLVMEHEMGELFKVVALSKGVEPWTPQGFVQGDRTHRL
ncbi:class I SAM-dependent methyltransferase [Comamonas sp. AG1104]|uniref:class I SAM-dependent methyltransferase n=1 Tax=Comamonas sp. AG1104 TaxID=2183900 RepID=UPI000E2C3531|nr:SAM-dependent methyltransferase [Comamonas sp. AG1104]RDI12755.1 SAM-dependent MidA family methyltransferase [Comamonas sp. AG1104]